jgi:hypothetical protein
MYFSSVQSKNVHMPLMQCYIFTPKFQVPRPFCLRFSDFFACICKNVSFDIFPVNCEWAQPKVVLNIVNSRRRHFGEKKISDSVAGRSKPSRCRHSFGQVELVSESCRLVCAGLTREYLFFHSAAWGPFLTSPPGGTWPPGVKFVP